ncbi:hypothetical protein BH09CHL1_BH09CHL1_29820 [soil metagenome]
MSPALFLRNVGDVFLSIAWGRNLLYRTHCTADLRLGKFAGYRQPDAVR